MMALGPILKPSLEMGFPTKPSFTVKRIYMSTSIGILAYRVEDTNETSR
jgi:hypothetical protein